MGIESYVRPWNFSLIREYRIGFGVLPSVAEICRAYKWQKPVIVTGNTTYLCAGKAVEDILTENNFSIQTIRSDATGAISDSMLSKACDEIKRPDCIIGVGGGSKIDIAKLVAEHFGCQMVSVPTSISHDGIASNLASTINNGVRESKKTVTPLALIADTKIIQNAPPRLNTAGVGDAVSNFTAVEDWRLASERPGQYMTNFSNHAYVAASATVQYLVEKIISSKNLTINDIMDTVILSHLGSATLMSVIGNSQPCSGAEHKFSHILDMDYATSTMHGEQVGVGTIVTSYLQAYKLNLQQIRRSFLFNLSWKKIRDALHKIGAPSSVNELGISTEQVTGAFKKARSFRPERHTILNEVSDGLIEKAVRKTIA